LFFNVFIGYPLLESGKFWILIDTHVDLLYVLLENVHFYGIFQFGIFMKIFTAFSLLL
jgi:hypothetical protein